MIMRDSNKDEAKTQDQNQNRAAADQNRTPDANNPDGLKVGDRVTIEAEIKAVTGEYLTLDVPKQVGTDGRTVSDGTTLTLSTKQVKKA